MIPAQSQLIPVFFGDLAGRQQPLCNARDLHEFLAVARDFSTWLKSRVAEYGFVEGEDFLLCSPDLGSKRRGGHNRTDYSLTLDMAKELAMVENNAKGREARRYFIAMERAALDAATRAPLPQAPSRPSLEDPWTAPVRAYLDAQLAATAPARRPALFVPMNALAVSLGIDPQAPRRSERTRVGMIVYGLGWQGARPVIEGRRVRGYRPGPWLLGLGDAGRRRSHRRRPLGRCCRPRRPRCRPPSRPRSTARPMP